MYLHVGLGPVWGLKLAWTMGGALCGEWGASGFWLNCKRKWLGKCLANLLPWLYLEGVASRELPLELAAVLE